MRQILNRRLRWAVAVALLAAGAAGTGCAGRGRSYTSAPESQVSRVVQRPRYGPNGEKNVYLGGYAGADYSRAARGR